MQTIIDFSPQSSTGMAWPQGRRSLPLAAIIVLHAVVFYALQSGMLVRVAKAFPKEVFVSFVAPIAPENTAVPLKTPALVKIDTAPPAPKTVDAVVLDIAIAPPAAPTQQSVQAPAPAAPQAVAAPALPRLITSGVQYIRQPSPSYPATSRRLHEEGKVMLRVLVGENGLPERVDIERSSGFSRLDEAARLAVLAALFKPNTEDGKAMAVIAMVPITFALDS